MSGISVVAVDLDGTLLLSDGSPAPEGMRLLKQAAENGVYVIVSTTRNPASVRPLSAQLEIDHPIVCTNGAQVWGSPDGPVWAHHTIPMEAALAVAQLADTHGWGLSITIESMIYWRQRPGQPLGEVEPNRMVVRTNMDALGEEPDAIAVWEPEAFQPVRELCQGLTDQCYFETYYRVDGSEHSLVVFPLLADKGEGLDLVLERLGIGWEEVVAIGDNPNDLPMIRKAGVGVAMGNAPDEVKREATLVAPSNDEEGVAWALKELELGEDFGSPLDFRSLPSNTK
jgi:Cof subfamily protein (haloacid dehalogenase superfamily)